MDASILNTRMSKKYTNERVHQDNKQRTSLVVSASTAGGTGLILIGEVPHTVAKKKEKKKRERDCLRP